MDRVWDTLHRGQYVALEQRGERLGRARDRRACDSDVLDERNTDDGLPIRGEKSVRHHHIGVQLTSLCALAHTSRNSKRINARSRFT